MEFLHNILKIQSILICLNILGKWKIYIISGGILGRYSAYDAVCILQKTTAADKINY